MSPVKSRAVGSIVHHCFCQEGLHIHALRGREAAPFCLGKWHSRNCPEYFPALPLSIFDTGAEWARVLLLSLWGQSPRKATKPISVQVLAGHSVWEGRMHGESSPISACSHPTGHLGIPRDAQSASPCLSKCCSEQRDCDGLSFSRKGGNAPCAFSTCCCS